MSTEVQESDWIKTRGYPGVTLGFNQLGFVNNHILVSADEKSGNEPGYRYSLCDGLSNWIPSKDPIFDGKCTALSSDGNNIIATAITETIHTTNKDYKFNVTTSFNGSIWSFVRMYSINDSNIDLTHVKSRYLAGTHFFLYTGFLFYSIREEWIYVPLQEKYKNAKILDVAYFNSTFFFLLEQNNRYYLMYSTDCSSFAYMSLVWPGIKIKSLCSNNNQLVAVGSENNEKKCVIMYTSIGITNEWEKLSFTPLLLEDGHSCSLYDMVHYRGSWYIVGSTSEIKNNRVFSVKGLTFKIEGDISISNPVLMETNPATNLKKIFINQKDSTIYSIGEARPTGDYFILYKRFTNGN